MISIIIPFYNESQNIELLIPQIIDVGDGLHKSYELILVNDGSNEQILNIQKQVDSLNIKYKKEIIKLITHRKKFGKGEALATGIKNASGEIFIFMDGDLQDDPKEIPIFLDALNNNCDFVNGIRKNRQDGILVKIYSFFAKKFLKFFLQSPYHDINCGFKAFKKEVLTDFVFYGNNFRFFPLAVFLKGYKIKEIPVTNHRRKFGRSKFGPSKLVIGVFDTLSAYFIFMFSEKPMHFFGPIGGVMFGIGFVIDLYLTIERVFFQVLLYRRPLFLYGILFTIVGLQIIMTGIIAELIVFMHKKTRMYQS